MAWFDGWTRAQRLVITVPIGTYAPLSYFPVLLTADSLPTELTNNTYGRSDGGDIAFATDLGIGHATASIGNRLPCEVVSASFGGSPTAEIHTQVPSVAASGTLTYIWLLYGNSSQTAQPAPNSTYGSQNVWNQNFVGVWHLQNPASIIDATSHGYNGTNVGTVTTSGQIGNGIADDGNEHYVDFHAGPTIKNQSEITLSGWIKSTTPSESRMVWDEGIYNDYIRFGLFQSYITPHRLTFRIRNVVTGDTGTPVLITSNTDLSTGWTHVAAVYSVSGSYMVLYQNGCLVASTTTNIAAMTNAVPLGIRLGNDISSSPLAWKGELDEFRLALNARSVSWIAAEYVNEQLPGTFIQPSGSPLSNFTYLELMSGGVEAGGSGSVHAEYLPSIDGGVEVGGSSEVHAEYLPSIDGGIEAGGSALIDTGFITRGGVEAGGSALIDYGYVSTGGAEAGGSALIDTGFITRGGAEVGGGAEGSSTFEISKTFSFNAGACIPYWWQVNGTCEQFQCILWGGTTWNPVLAEQSLGSECKRSFVTTIMACNLQELCLKLQERGLQFTIEKIYKYTVPALIENADLFEGCGTFVEVPLSSVDVPVECVDFFLSGSVNEVFGAVVSAEFVCKFVGAGGIEFSGCAAAAGNFDELEYNSDFSSSYGDSHCLTVNNLHITGVGGLEFATVGVFYGDFDLNCGFVDELLSIDYNFADEEFPGGLAVSKDIVSEACACGPYPLELDVTHNLNDADKLHLFLQRNQLVLPSAIKFSYNLLAYSWQANFHYKGYGEDGNSLELWDLLFEWACTDEIGGSVTNQMWKLGVYVRQKNLVSGDSSDARILLAFFPSDVCRAGLGLRYGFELNTETKIVYSKSQQLNINVDLNTCFDNMGLFSGNNWLKSPNLIMSVYQNGVPSTMRRVDVGFMLPASQLPEEKVTI